MKMLLSSTLQVEQQGAVASLTLNRPARCNAINVELSTAIISACSDLCLNPGVSVVVVRGNGRHFCAGSDLNDLYQVDRQEAERVIRLEIDACCALAALPQLTVALMHGKCFGAGAVLPLYCDLRIGRAGVELAMPEVPLGWAPPYGLERLITNVPRSAGIEMLLSGRICGDKEALAKGWLHRLLETEESAQPLIEQLAEIPQRVVRDTLALTYARDIAVIRAADEKALATFLSHFDSEYAREKISAFIHRKRG
jgi:enoyl-CoA hydratase/carnithine racemase